MSQQSASSDYLKQVGEIVQELGVLGHPPILVGGMALVVLGSQRVTKDFDFVVGQIDEDIAEVLAIFYRRGLQLVSKIDKLGEIQSTIDNKNVAAARLKLDRPDSAYFFNPKTGLRIDLLFDFPLKAADLAKGATKIKVKSYALRIASTEDLIRLKKLAQSNRSSPNDDQDLAFLKSL